MRLQVIEVAPFVHLPSSRFTNNIYRVTLKNPTFCQKGRSPANAYASYHLPQEDEENAVNPWAGFDSLRFRCFPSVRSGTLIGACNRNNPVFIDVINSIICLISSSGSSISIILWNPSIRKYVVIPNSSEISDDLYTRLQNHRSLGFGFDGSTDDFRVIRLWMLLQIQKPLVYYAFSLKAGVWRRMSVDVTDFIRPCEVVSECSLYLNGVIHWIIVSNINEEFYVLMFDCQGGEFKKIEAPARIQTILGAKTFQFRR